MDDPAAKPQNPAAIVLRCRKHRRPQTGPGVKLTFRRPPSSKDCPNCRTVHAPKRPE